MVDGGETFGTHCPTPSQQSGQQTLHELYFIQDNHTQPVRSCQILVWDLTEHKQREV